MILFSLDKRNGTTLKCVWELQRENICLRCVREPLVVENVKRHPAVKTMPSPRGIYIRSNSTMFWTCLWRSAYFKQWKITLPKHDNLVDLDNQTQGSDLISFLLIPRFTKVRKENPCLVSDWLHAKCRKNNPTKPV